VYRQHLLCSALALAVLLSCASARQQTPTQDRQPAVAGQFYPGDAVELRSTLEDLFAHAIPSKGLEGVVAIIAPHAGYVFSGGVAASSHNQVDSKQRYENIFVLGPSHYVGFEGASIYVDGNFITPLGPVQVNAKLGKQIIEKNRVFVARTDAHLREHSVEVQLPFLQYRFGKECRIVPIVLGASLPSTCKEIADGLRPYFNGKNLFVISSDFSHYPAYEDARRADRATAEAIVSRSPDNLISVMSRNEEQRIPNLVTSACGWPCILTLLYLVQDNPQATLQIIDYKNSGDAAVGEKKRVVGYYAIAVTIHQDTRKGSFDLNNHDKKDLLLLARKTVEQQVNEHKVSPVDPSSLSGTLVTNCGAFVTLRKNGDLRGCIGRFDATEPLYKVVQQMAIASSTEDYRFSPVTPREVNQLEIEISVLTPMRRIKSIDEIEMGKHGIYIRKGTRAGTFLPQVATETGWTKEQFLGHCAEEKAGIGWDGWKDAEIYVYEALVFSEKDLKLR
jgi:AmmeMemoRadiSam system protein B/AmmeMemoRadiSam system protein A